MTPPSPRQAAEYVGKFPIFQHFLLTRLEKSDTMNQGIALITDLVLSDGF